MLKLVKKILLRIKLSRRKEPEAAVKMQLGKTTASLSRRFCESKLQMRNSKQPTILSTSQYNNKTKEEIIRTTVSKISKEDFKPNLANYL